MKNISAISTLYNPTQPSLHPGKGNVIYREFSPHRGLLDFIYCYWELKTTQRLMEPFRYRVVADGCIDIFFDLSRPDENFVMGFSNRYVEFPLENTFHYIGVRFLPTMFPQLFKIDASELTNRFENLNMVVPAASRFIAENINPELPGDAIRNIFDRYFIELLSGKEVNADPRFYLAVEAILRSAGNINIETGLDTGISPRQLRRMFRFYIGETPKTFARVVRFQQLLQAKPSLQSLKENKLFYDAGYYDQAHFIKEFRHYYGDTPGQAFGR